MVKRKIKLFTERNLTLVRKLHSDKLKERFGPITVRIKKGNKKIRISSLIDQEGISRTIAFTFFAKRQYKSRLDMIIDKIKRGESIGYALIKNGYQLYKTNYIDFVIQLNSWLKREFKVKELFALSSLYKLFVKSKHNGSIEFLCELIEIYSPAFRNIRPVKIKKLESNNKIVNLNRLIKYRMRKFQFNHPFPKILTIIRRKR